MQLTTRDNLAKLFYDFSKISFAVLVIGAIVKRPFVMVEFLWGVSATLLCVAVGYILNEGKMGKF